MAQPPQPPGQQHPSFPPPAAAPSTTASAPRLAQQPQQQQQQPASACASQSPVPQGQPQTAAAAAAAAAQQQAAFRPLNVRDALQYLDRVKQQFANEYEVYDQFLTIMKDFKTQNIDTPGVIDRVSSLFRDHPSLIQGFNTFLPPGYRIECHVAPSGPGGVGGSGGTNTITVTTPMGVTTRTQNVAGSVAPSAPSTSAAAPLPGAASAAPAAPGTSAAARPPASTAAAAALPTQTRLPPLPGMTASGASTPAPPRPISPPAPIPPFGGNRNTPAGGAAAWNQSQQPQRPKPAAAAGGFGAAQQQPAARSAVGQAPAAPAPAAYGQQQQQAQQDVKPDPHAHAQPAPQPAAAQQPAAPGAGPAPIMEFNHAINYVNKIKNRFAKDPETYKTFLEILQTYQKDQRPIQEVYTQVTALFRDAPDLLDEFKAFLPDTSADAGAAAPSPAAARQKAAGGPATGQKPGAAKPGIGLGVGGGPLPGQAPEKKKRAAPGTSEKAKAKRAKMAHQQAQAEQQQRAAAAQQAQQQQQQQQHVQAQQLESPPIGGPSRDVPPSPYGAAHPAAAAAAPTAHHPHPYGAPPPGFPGAPRMQSAYDTYLTSHRNPPLVQPEEFGFFDRVKKHIDDRDTYTEFLKLLNLFTQEVIDLRTLLSKSLLFIGGDDLLVAQFKELVGWDPVRDGRVSGEDWIIDNEPVLERPRVELHLMKSFGPSYRKLPDSEIDLACSGRSALDWSVLNDEWVAFATWASEGSGAHRKNPYEEALYNSEQERHWYSFHIESMARTVGYFETVAARLALMSAEERAAFKLGPAPGEDGAVATVGPYGWGGLGGTAPSVYERIVRKIYGKDHGWEIVQALEDNPAVAVPIVLTRLKQKDEEWKRAEREWNKVWREVDAKNYYRALDHQGIPFKAIDKKATTTSKSLTIEIDTLRREKQMRRYDTPGYVPNVHPSQSSSAVTYPSDSASPSLPPPLRPTHQFELYMTDRAVLFDVLKLTFSYLDRDQTTYSTPERARVEAFLRLFVPLLWNIPVAEMEANLGHSSHDLSDEQDEDEMDTEADVATNGAASETDSAAGDGGSDDNSAGGGKRNGASKRGGAADLRKRLLVHAAATAGKNVPGGGAAGAKAGSRAASPTDEDDGDLGRLMDASWIQLTETKEDGEPVVPPSADEELEPRKYSFFANATFYCLVRVIHTIYHRLLAFKQLAAELANSHKHRRLSPLGVKLGLSTPVAAVDTGDNPAEHYYEHLLDLAEKLFDGDIDQQTYEEQLRYMAGIWSYPLFTLDKLTATVIKHIHTINGDNRCQDIATLLEQDRARPATTPRQQIAYRMEAESVLGQDDNLYRVEWIPTEQALTIQLLAKHDPTLEGAYGSDPSKMHQAWLASYALASPSEGIGAQVKAPLLKRNRVLSAAEDPQDFDLSPGLEAKVSSQGYQLFFVANTGDFLHRRRPPPDADADDAEAAAEPIRQRRKERFERWLDEQLHPGEDDEEPRGGEGAAAEEEGAATEVEMKER
ncbi:hypothetical protein JCM6882_002816 [Rhodosporidiobolus microsporus]